MLTKFTNSTIITEYKNLRMGGSSFSSLDFESVIPNKTLSTTLPQSGVGRQVFAVSGRRSLQIFPLVPTTTTMEMRVFGWALAIGPTEQLWIPTPLFHGSVTGVNGTAIESLEYLTLGGKLVQNGGISVLGIPYHDAGSTGAYRAPCSVVVNIAGCQLVEVEARATEAGIFDFNTVIGEF